MPLLGHRPLGPPDMLSSRGAQGGSSCLIGSLSTPLHDDDIASHHVHFLPAAILPLHLLCLTKPQAGT